MGTINYLTSDYITLALKPCNEWDDFDRETETEATLEIVKDLLAEHDFYFFSVSIEYGYYEGFSILIENAFPDFWYYTEKRDAQKEITEIKKFLFDCVEAGLYPCFPGWCTGYTTEQWAIKAEISTAIKEMRQAVNNSKTWKTYNKKEC